MHKPYWVGDYLVDPSRNQITHFEQVQVLQPKMLSVLNLLAKHSGEVVSHEQLMTHVWPNIYVTTNTLQRCIAELRKAFGDDSKRQNVIKTHSKQGYSLELPVKRPEGLHLREDLPNKTNSLAYKKGIKKWSLVGILVAIVAVTLMALQFPAIYTPLALNNLTPLTASDEKEFYPNYSPDGKYMVFHRYLDVCNNHIWAKDLETQQEFRLTQSPGVYGAHSWSPEGTQLVFTVQENCSQDAIVKKLCWRLQTLDFTAALRTPQTSSLNYDCDTQWISDPHWLSDDQIVVMHKDAEHTKLVKYNPIHNQLADFYLETQGSIYFFDYSPVSNQIAVFSLSQMGEHQLTMLNLDGSQTFSLTLSLPTDVSIYSRIEPRFLPDATGFLLSTNNRLLRIDLDGKFTQIDSAHTMNLHTPVYHPNRNRILASKGLVDADIAVISISDTIDNNDKTTTFYPSLVRSNSYDANAVFQPRTDNISFFSKRSGNTQIWMSNLSGENATQISHFPKYAKISNFVWSKDGQRAATTVNDRLIILHLGAQQEEVKTNFPIDRILHWIDDQRLLIQGKDSRFKQLQVFNITSQEREYTGVDDVYWAYMSELNGLFYIDQNKRLWNKRGDTTTEIQSLEGQLDGKRFLMRDNKLYGVNWQQQLWQFDVISMKFDILMPLKAAVWWVSDVRENQVLITQIISSKQEVIELSL